MQGKWHGQEYALEKPEIIPASEALGAFPQWARFLASEHLFDRRNDEISAEAEHEAWLVLPTRSALPPAQCPAVVLDRAYRPALAGKHTRE
jgi:hypothetical protein